MRLATFTHAGYERFGLVLRHPLTGADWVFDPALVEARLAVYASRGTSAYAVSKPVFWGRPWPQTLADALAAGERLAVALRHMADFLQRFLESSDQYMLTLAGWPLDAVDLRAPIPRPRLFFGLVQNSPTVWRHTPARRHINLFPQGHQRPQGAVLGPGDPLVLPYTDRVEGGWNPELGVIVGTGGRDIPVERAMAHVAGLTVVSDVTFDYFRRTMFEQPEPYDWFEDAMSSWGDKKSDGRSPMGPFLVTLDEIGNPYDLLIYTRQSGYLRDRSHTGAMSLSIERTLSWLSSFRTLLPGDVIHMGTMGYDGSPVGDELADGAYLESEIEKVGVLRNPIRVASADELEQPARRLFAVPNLRDLVAAGADVLADPADWTPEQARHFWVCFGNTPQAGLTPRPYPRFLNAPNTALAAANTVVTIPPRAGTLSLSCEIACVIGRLTSRVNEAEAEASILGYTVLAALHDSSFADAVIEPATPQERHLPAVYARWADGFNVVGTTLHPAADLRDSVCVAGFDGVGEVRQRSADYQMSAPQVIAFISRYITLYPGDVVTLGSLAEHLVLPPEAVANGASGYAEVDGLGRVQFSLRRA
jgi:2-keto-4-pentenoate hydratase/2-oxohepta-3-ene-1,7-dioic acid hydratase in catechol pathway